MRTETLVCSNALQRLSLLDASTSATSPPKRKRKKKNQNTDSYLFNCCITACIFRECPSLSASTSSTKCRMPSSARMRAAPVCVRARACVYVCVLHAFLLLSAYVLPLCVCMRGRDDDRARQCMCVACLCVCMREREIKMERDSVCVLHAFKRSHAPCH